MKNRINVNWGGGESSLFLDLTGKKPRVLDFEYDGEELHERCGGKTYYVSRSGCSGAGYLMDIGSLLPLGTYRVDTVHNNCQSPVSVGEAVLGYKTYEVLVLAPYASHTGDKSQILRDHPMVVKFGNKVVYCDFESNFTDVLRLILSGEALPEECEIGGVTYGRRGHRTMRRNFTGFDRQGGTHEEENAIEFYNLCSMEETPNPWEFCVGGLGSFESNRSEERMFELLSVEKLGDGTFVKRVKIAGEWYRGEILEGDPLKTGKLTAGWRQLAADLLIRFYDGSREAHLVAYAPARKLYEKMARRLAYHVSEGEEFISFISSVYDGEYVEFELVLPKTRFLLSQADYLTELRRGLAQKVREDVSNRVYQWIDSIGDQAILEAVPDDLVVTFEDSLEAGNCRPGTESFVNKFFPGQVQTTAKELKRYSDNYNVMRIFHHLAATGRFSCKAG